MLDLMNAADLKVDRLTRYYAIVDDPRISDTLFAEPRDLWTMVTQGDMDAAIVPFDDVAEEMQKRPVIKRLHIEPLTGDLLFIANAISWREREEELQDILLLLKGAAEAKGRVLLKLHVEEENLTSVLELLPALKAPTVVPLEGSEPKAYAVETVMPRNEVNLLIPKLLRVGATDIIEVPITKLIRGTKS